MKRSEEIVQLSHEIMLDLTDDRLPLHNILLKASRLSLLLDIPSNVELFQSWAKYAEQSQFNLDAYKDNLVAARDPNVSVSSANPNQYVWNNQGNSIERAGIRQQAQQRATTLSDYRAKTYNFVLGVYNKWQFGGAAQTIFERKRARAEPVLQRVFPDTSQRLNSIEQNLLSSNPEDWKNAVSSCRALLMDIADILNPPKDAAEKPKYINRLKDFVSPRVASTTKKKLLKTYFDELKTRIEYTMDLTQGGAHQDRYIKEEAEDVVLQTYLIIAELMQIYDVEDKRVRAEELLARLKKQQEADSGETAKKKSVPKKKHPDTKDT